MNSYLLAAVVKGVIGLGAAIGGYLWFKRKQVLRLYPLLTYDGKIIHRRGKASVVLDFADYNLRMRVINRLHYIQGLSGDLAFNIICNRDQAAADPDWNPMYTITVQESQPLSHIQPTNVNLSFRISSGELLHSSIAFNGCWNTFDAAIAFALGYSFGPKAARGIFHSQPVAVAAPRLPSRVKSLFELPVVQETLFGNTY
jgi:hypothetical protein